MIRVYYFEKMNGVEVLRVEPPFHIAIPDFQVFEMTHAKWAYICEYLATKRKPNEQWPTKWFCDGGGSTQALCWQNYNCTNCPIAIETGQRLCAGTPFDQYKYETTLENAEAMRDWLWDLMVELGLVV